ncbi:AAA family ATPase [Bradyrhizobium sp. CCGB12]|uniref:ATP-binding protein n=1 Tax=Bradyrhizobium sp. CCGB12 TaxID=2949632 RepID=UPI0020B2E4C0|nr:adenylate/guanylate cyclase domain-containing protein [Bradyrhizobium sp. CCGB12]MCP3389405.1 AAA family ATPase [Bradyrhizobium sp. CCGB12]
MTATVEGQPLSGFAEAERRQVTVVFVDLVGSTRLAETLDPEDVGDLIVAFRRAATAAIEAHGGFVARYLGDGILAYWGYPKANEQDPRRAVSGGLAVVAAIGEVNRTLPIGGAQLSVRVGIDSGIVVVGKIGTPGASATADIVGGAPNVAARVQQLAHPNTVFVTETVRQLVHWQFEFAAGASVELKGVAAPVWVHQVTAERKGSERTRSTRSGRIYNREIERSLLDQCWHGVLAGRGHTVLISGEPGIGKTTLADYFRQTVVVSGGTCLYSTCAPEGTHSPLLPIRDLMRQAIGITLLDDAVATRFKLAASQVNADASEILSKLLAQGASELQPLELGFHAPTTTEAKEQIFTIIADWMLEHSRSTPQALIIEDLQWADSSTLEVLDRIMGRVASTRSCVLLTWRTGFQTTWIDRADVTRLSVMRLKDETVQALVAGMVGDKAMEMQVQHAIVARAEGNPLFAEELVLLAGQRPVATAPSDMLTLPSSLNDSLSARLDSLGDLKPIAQIAAVIGREFDEQVLARVLDVSRADLAPMLETLVASGLVVDLGAGLQASHSFKHALVREVGYNSLLKVRRRAIHAKIAAVLVDEFPQTADAHPELIAQHYERASMFDEALIWWSKAGVQAARRSATRESILSLERARTLFGCLPDDEARACQKAELLNLLGVQYIAAHGYASPLVEQSFREAAGILETRQEAPSDQLFTAFWGLHTHAMVRSNVPVAIEIGGRILKFADVECDSDKILQAHRLQGLARLLMGEHRQAANHYEEVLRRYDSLHHESHRFRYGADPAALALAQLAWSEWIGGHIAQSERHSLESVAQAQKLEHPHSIVYACGVNALRLLTAREFARSAQIADEAYSLAKKHGFIYWIAWCEVILAALQRAVNPDRARALLAAAKAKYQSTGARQIIPYAHALEAECCLDLDRVAEASTVLNEALGLVEETGVRIYQAELLRLRACVSFRLGDPSAKGYIEASLNIAREQAAGSFVLRSLITWLENATEVRVHSELRRNIINALLGMAGQPETVDMRQAQGLIV